MTNDPWATGPQTNDPWTQHPQQQQGGDPWANTQQPAPPGAYPGGDPWAGPQQGQGQPPGPTPPSLNDALAGAGRSAFTQNTPVGTVVEGDIIEAQTKLDQFRPYWDDGNPNWRIVVQLQTRLHEDPDDDGKRTVYVKTYGANFRAFQDAVKATGVDAETALAPGGYFGARLTGHQRSSRGGNPELLFAYRMAPRAQGQRQQPPPQPPPAQQQQGPPPQQQLPNEEPPF